MTGGSTVWKDTDGCAKKYMCALDIYLMTVLSSSYGMTMDGAINETVHGKNVVDELNAKDKCSLKGRMELIDKLSSNDTTNIGMLPRA